MGSIDPKREWDFPSLKEVLTLTDLSNDDDLEDVKFFPYSKSNEDPIFAANSTSHILICRVFMNKKKAAEVLSIIRDDDPDARNSSIVWSISHDKIPLLCVGGGNAKIKIINALTGELRMTLTGHGGDVNDLAVSPLDPSILASGSEDTSIRLWDLNAKDGMQCVVILAGEGHRDTILSIAFHESGRYLLSSGQDRIINLWMVPKIPAECERGEKPVMVHFPHFSTNEIHERMVDCVAFHHDLIISKDDKGRAITLWKIVGFSSSDTPAQPLKAVTVLDSTKDTRSAFLPHSSPDDISPQYIRLVEFVIEDCREFYMRFSLYTPPLTSTRHPILAICDSKSKVFFWDLARLDSYHEYINSLPTSQRPQWLKPKARPKKNNALNGVHDASPYSSLASSSPHAKPNETFPKNFTPADIKRSKADWDKKYSTGRSARLVESAPEENMTVEQVTKNMLDSHRSPEVIGHVLVGGEHILVGGRQATWSPGGEFCVVGGSPNVVAVFQRWGDINWK